MIQTGHINAHCNHSHLERLCQHFPQQPARIARRGHSRHHAAYLAGGHQLQHRTLCLQPAEQHQKDILLFFIRRAPSSECKNVSWVVYTSNSYPAPSRGEGCSAIPSRISTANSPARPTGPLLTAAFRPKPCSSAQPLLMHGPLSILKTAAGATTLKAVELECCQARTYPSPEKRTVRCMPHPPPGTQSGGMGSSQRGSGVRMAAPTGARRSEGVEGITEMLSPPASAASAGRPKDSS